MNSILICTACPVGCEIRVQLIEPGHYVLSGYTCDKGKTYGEQELTNPMRILTTTIKITDGVVKRLPVRSNGYLPRSEMFKYMNFIKLIEMVAPIREGDVIIPNIFHSGVDIIASRSVVREIKRGGLMDVHSIIH